MVRLCTTCLGIYATAYLNGGDEGYYRCPNTKCGHREMIEVDDAFVDIVADLFRLGIPTKVCCSGHVYTEFFTPLVRFEPPSIKEGNLLYQDLLAFRSKNTALGKYCIVDITLNSVGRFIDLKGVREKDSAKWFETGERLKILRGFEDFVRAFVRYRQAKAAS